MTKLCPMRAWAVFDPSGRVDVYSVALSRGGSVFMASPPGWGKDSAEVWAMKKKQGYRCCRILISPEVKS